MEKIDIYLNSLERHYRPKSTVSGRVRWHFDQLKRAHTHIHIGLSWETSGKGSTDSQTAIDVKIALYGNSVGEQEFHLELPLSPVSFEGRLIALQWYVEAWMDDEYSRENIIVSRTQSLLHLPRTNYLGLKGKYRA
jgi:hypothetical protein